MNYLKMKKYPEYDYSFQVIGSDLCHVKFVSEIRDNGLLYADRFEFKFDSPAELADTLLEVSRHYNIILKKQYEEHIDRP